MFESSTNSSKTTHLDARTPEVGELAATSGHLSSVSPGRRQAARPKRVGPYRTRTVLGAGGMATVYLATCESRLGNRRFCALKVLDEQLKSRDQYMSMFLNEARIASEITHPHVANVFDYGSADGHAYLAMEYLHGKSLASVARACEGAKSPVSLDQHALRVARILADVCEGLSAIHEYGTLSEGRLNVVHRDISPDNLILGFDGFVKVIDFGLAKVASRNEQTRSGILKGKISYLAPELLQGEPATQSADIWSLGVVAWELLTGKRLFRKATDAETLRALAEQAVAAPSEMRPGLPPELDDIVLRALQRDPGQRYSSASELGADLWWFLRRQPRLPQHRELGDWLDRLFPGEREQQLRRLEAMPAGTPGPEQSEERRARHSQRLMHGLRGRVGPALFRRPPLRSLAAGLCAALVLGLGLFHWGSTRSHATGALAAGLPLASPALAPAEPMQLRSDSPRAGASGLVVRVERVPHSSEVLVHVRPAPDE